MEIQEGIVRYFYSYHIDDKPTKIMNENPLNQMDNKPVNKDYINEKFHI